MNDVSMFSVTPEPIAEYSAHVVSNYFGRDAEVIDAFAGVGGNTIQFAKYGSKVLSAEMDDETYEYCLNNLEIYGVKCKSCIINGDYLKLSPQKEGKDFLRDDFYDKGTVFLSPPWGGKEYVYDEKYDVTLMTPPVHNVLRTSLNFTRNLMLYLPCNIDLLEFCEILAMYSSELSLNGSQNDENTSDCQVLYLNFEKI